MDHFIVIVISSILLELDPNLEFNRKEILQLILDLARNGLESMSVDGSLKEGQKSWIAEILKKEYY